MIIQTSAGFMTYVNIKISVTKESIRLSLMILSVVKAKMCVFVCMSRTPKGIRPHIVKGEGLHHFQQNQEVR